MVRGFVRNINLANEWSAKIFGWLLIPLLVIVFCEVIAMYVFNRPSIWAWDVNILILGIITVLTGGYGLLKGAHVSVDILVVRHSAKTQAIIRIMTSMFFFLGMAVLLWQSVEGARDSILVAEKRVSLFAPPFYPFKIIIVVGVVLLLLQGIANFIRDLQITFRGAEGELK